MVVFFKTFAIFLALSVFIVYVWWLLAEDDIDFDFNHAKWVVFGCLVAAIAECLGIPVLKELSAAISWFNAPF